MVSLFERLDTLADDRRSHDSQTGDVSDSVRRHLYKLLNTRVGSVSIQTLYGITDFNDLMQSSSDLPDAVAQEVAVLITNMEPRLSQVQVTPQKNPDDPTNLHFTIVCKLKVKEGLMRPARFDLSFGCGRSPRVTSRNS